MANLCSNRSRLMLGCGGAALAAALAIAPDTARADAFQATPTTVDGSVTYDRTTTGLDRIEISSPTAIIDWVPTLDVNGDPLTFLPAGTTASFYDAPGQGGFAVLNRILPTSNGGITVMNGAVVSSLQTSAGVFQPGGFVAFYSPTGFLIGSTATFDVGSLMLTTLEPSIGSFNAFSAGTGSLFLTGLTGTTAPITISPGAAITAPAEGSYFIAAGAQLNIGGTIGINGSHAYVAAQQATLTHNAGLFDIIIPLGTDVANALTINGNIGGPSSGGAGDNHMIYAVAQANSNPIQMVFGGNLGFAPAASAGIVNGEIILSANYDVFGRTVNGSSVADGNLGLFTGRGERSTVQADIRVDAANLSSNTLAISSHSAQVAAITGSTVVDGNLQVVGRQSARMVASNGQALLVTGDALVASNDAGLNGSSFQSPNDINAVGGLAYIDADTGGIVSINGNAVVSAYATAGSDLSAQSGGTAQAGQAAIRAVAGTINLGGDTQIVARGRAAAVGVLISGGDVTAGTAQLGASQGGAVTFTGNALLDASAAAANVSTGISSGTVATGGTVVINAFDVSGTISFGGDLIATALAEAGDGNSSGTGAIATAGTVDLAANAAGTLIEVDGNVQLIADAYGADNVPGTGGAATAGRASTGTSNGGTVIYRGDTVQVANAFGGSGATGGAANGGRSVIFSSAGSVTTTGGVLLNANGTGGAGASVVGGNGTGGRASMSVNGGAITVGGLFDTFAVGQGGNGTSGGNGFGGIAGAVAQVGTITINQGANVRSIGRGGNASFGFGGTGGTGRGGNAFLQAEGTLVADGRLTVNLAANLNASGFGGTGGAGNGSTVAGGRGGDGFGGNPTIPNAADPAFGSGVYALAQGDRGYITLTGGVQAEASGQGGDGGNSLGPTGGGDGGNGQGGLAQLGLFIGGGNGSVSAGRAEFGGLARARAAGVGGAGGVNSLTGLRSGDGGNGIGANTLLASRLSDVVADSVLLESDGIGGEGVAGGTGTGGQTAMFANSGGAVTLNTITVSAGGIGGNGQADTGGAGTGGLAFIGFENGTVIVAGNAQVSADGRGGASTNADGAVGTGGMADIANINPVAGNAAIGGAAVVTANGVGGMALSAGFTGGIGNGGEAYLLSQGGATLQLGSAQVIASGTGGSGPSAKGGAGNGGLSYIEARGTGSLLSITNIPPMGTDLATQGALLGAMGIGGNTTGADGIGGTGTGGTTNIVASTGGTINLPLATLAGNFVRVLARGFGGNSSVDGGAGGLGIGGILTIEADGGTLTSGNILPSSYAQGGTSTEPTLNVDGGDARDGERRIIVENGGVLNASFSGGIAGGAGGNGTGTGNGGNASGGTATLVVNGGTANLQGLSIFVAQNIGGNAIAGNGGTATGGLATVEVTNGGVINLIADTNGAGELLVGTNNNGGNSTSGAGGSAVAQTARLQVATGGSLNGGSYLVNSIAAGGASSTGAGGAATGGLAQAIMNGATSTVDVLAADSSATGGVSLSGSHGSATGGNAQVAIIGSALNAATGVYALANASTGVDPAQVPTTATGGDATGGNAQIALLQGTLVAGSLSVTSRAAALQNGSATGGNVAIGMTASNVTAQNEVFLAADASSNGGPNATGGSVNLVVQRTSPSFPTITGPSSQLTTPLLTASSNAAGALATTGGSIALGVNDSRADVGVMSVSSTGADGAGSTNWVAEQNGTFAINQQATVDVSGDVFITSISGGLIGGPTVTAPTADISIRTPRTITIEGDNDNAINFGGQSLTLESSELEVLSGARFGAENVTLIAIGGTAPAIIGGTVEEAGYTLTAAEAERIEVGSFEFRAGLVSSADPNAPDLVIRDIGASGSDGDGISSIRIDAFGSTSAGGQGIIRIEGEMAYIDAVATDRLEINAGERIEIVTPGGISISGTNGSLTGVLALNAPNIWAADADTITQLQGDPNFIGRNDLLATAAAGSEDPLGYVRGGTVALVANGSILVRNTGSIEEQGGITVGSGGLSIAFEPDQASSSDPLDVFAYGRQQNANGTFVTGAAFYALVNFNQTNPNFPVRYLTGSEFNDCDISTGECPNNFEESEELGPPVNNAVMIEQPVEESSAPVEAEDQTAARFGFDFPSLIETTSITDQGTYDDGVMSGGDSSIYAVAPSDEKADKADEDEENEGGN